MKSCLSVSWTAALFFLLMISGFPQPAAASADDLEVSHSFDRTDYVPSEAGNVTLTIKNTAGKQVVIGSVRIRTDWQAQDEYLENSTPAGRVLEATGDSCQVRVAFRVPSTAKAADHSWNVTIVYVMGGPGATSYWTSENQKDLRVSDYEIVVFPDSKMIFAGEKAYFTVTVLGKNGFSKEVALSSNCHIQNGRVQPWNICYPQTVRGQGGSTLVIKTEPSTRTGAYWVTVDGHCPNGTTEYHNGTVYPGISRGAHSDLIVDPRPRGLIDMSANCAAQIGIVAIIAIAVLTAGLFAAERRRERMKQG